ncbi:class I SAM-dependent methyltransferase [Bordetella genomosp. 13]|uniref:class I SAM-dependent methyltransferase n=1 Tax=Bordetella genomosp. 13 TaxID=463040 RepID=UPI0011AA3A42|nr:class I SAM-dependent methyltransferase [Bordetella genomosp. 13]
MTTNTHDAAVDRQFGPQAAAYLASTVHAQGEDLRQLAALAGEHPQARVLDLGCGGGHVSFHVAPRVAHVTAYDLSQQMLDVVAAEAARRGLSNVATCRGKAERLPFGDEEFDLVMCRYSTHHWSDPGKALREALRVLKPRGTAVFVDVVSPGQALLDTWLQAIEVLRDTSHVRNYSASEWTRMLAEAGFVPRGWTPRRLPLEFSSWVARMRTPDTLVAALRHLSGIAPEPVRRYFQVQEDGSFTSDTLTIVAAKPCFASLPEPGCAV